MVAVSPDQLGVAGLLGRYLAIRAMSDADEFDAIERAFTELSAEEKAKLYAHASGTRRRPCFCTSLVTRSVFRTSSINIR